MNNRIGNISTEVMELSDTIKCFTVNASWKTRIHSTHVSLLCDFVMIQLLQALSREEEVSPFVQNYEEREQNKQCVSLIKLKNSSLE